MDVAIDVNEDGSGAIRTVQAVDVGAVAQGGAGAFEPGDLLPERGDLPDNVTASSYRQGGYEGVELRAEFQDLDELDSRLQDIADVRRHGSRRSRRHDRTPRPATPWPGSASAAPSTAGRSRRRPGRRAELARRPRPRRRVGLRLQVRLPGRPLLGRNNADEVHGNTFIWELRAADPRDELFAETGPGSPGSSDGRWLWAGLMVGFATLATLAVVWLARRHQPRPQAAEAAPPAQGPACRPPPARPRRGGRGDGGRLGLAPPPPPHPPLMPPSPWSTGAAYNPPVSWAPGGPGSLARWARRRRFAAIRRRFDLSIPAIRRRFDLPVTVIGNSSTTCT